MDDEMIKKELDELRELRRTLQEELAELRREKEEIRRLRERRRYREELHRGPPPHLHRAQPPFGPHAVIDLTGLTESLEDLMAGLGEQIRTALAGVKNIDTVIGHPPMWKLRKHRRKRIREIESIPPERIARIISPLGSVDRLRILDFLRDGGKSFNELEVFLGKTGSSLTHHLSPLIEAGYVVKGEVRGKYYITVVGRLAYRLAQWLTYQVEYEQDADNDKKSEVQVEFEDEGPSDNSSPDNNSEEDW